MSNRRAFSIFVLTIASLAQTAGATETKLGVQVTPFGAYRFGGEFDVEQSDDSYKLDDSSSIDIIVNFPHTENSECDALTVFQY